MLFGISNAASINDLKQQLKEHNQKIQQNQQQLREVKKQKGSIVNQIEEIDNQISDSEDKIQTLKTQIAKLDNNVTSKEKELKEATEKAQDQEELFKKRVKAMYETKSVSKLSFLLDSDNVSDFLEKYELINKIANHDKEILNDYKDKQEQIKDIKEEIERALNDRQEAKQEEHDKSRILNVSRGNRTLFLERLDQTQEELEKSIDEELEQSNLIEQKIKEITKDTTQKYDGSGFLWPAPASHRITSPFGNRFHPVLKKYKMHTGIDIGVGYGNNILAANGGKVILAQYWSGYGNAVIIDHGSGITTLYGHSSKLLVHEGQIVTKGQVIAKVGSTGISTGPHLHFEVRKNGSPVDPMGYVK